MPRRLALLFPCLAIALALAASCAKAGPCERNSDCDVGSYCGAGTCKRDCIAGDRDCDPGYVCNMSIGKCQASDGGVLPDGALPDGAPDGAFPDGAADSGAPDGGNNADGGQPGTNVELDLCAADVECKASLICRPLYKNGPGRCTRTCQSSASCWTGTRCLVIANDQYCAQSDVGRTCNVQSPAACNWGCVSPGYCTLPCQSGADCPNGFGCATVQNQKVCVRAEQYCGQGGMTCTSLLCDQSGLVDSCTLSCGSASDCPQRALPLAGWTCAGNVCKRPADVWGPLGQAEPAEYACSPQNAKVNLCNDTLHIDFSQFTIPNAPAYNCPVGSSVAGANGDSCVDSCRFAGGCVHGFACTSVGNVSNQRVGLCLPSLGAGEVGAACVHDGDCAFGYCASNKCSRDCTQDGLCPTGSTCTAGGAPNVENLPFRRCQ
jgi:hypothetical protein